MEEVIDSIPTRSTRNRSFVNKYLAASNLEGFLLLRRVSARDEEVIFMSPPPRHG
jgi:hypothetical protein